MCSRLPPPLLVLMCAVAVLLAARGGSGRGDDHQAVEPTGPIVAAVVRGDGVLVPFATFDAGTWAPPHYSSIAGLAAPW